MNNKEFKESEDKREQELGVYQSLLDAFRDSTLTNHNLGVGAYDGCGNGFLGYSSFAYNDPETEDFDREVQGLIDYIKSNDEITAEELEGLLQEIISPLYDYLKGEEWEYPIDYSLCFFADIKGEVGRYIRIEIGDIMGNRMGTEAKLVPFTDYYDNKLGTEEYLEQYKKVYGSVFGAEEELGTEEDRAQYEEVYENVFGAVETERGIDE